MGTLPPFQSAIVVPDELPEMPATIIVGVLHETHMMLLTGPSKANKTRSFINLAVSVATGGWWMGMGCARRHVLYIDLETDPRTLQRRISTVALAKGADAATVRANLPVCPLHERDDTGLLTECKPNFGGLSEASRARIEAENDGKVAALDAACERLVGDGEFCFRDDVMVELGWSPPTVNRWVDQSKRFMRVSGGGAARATIVRRPADVAATAPLSEGPAVQGEGGQDELPLKVAKPTPVYRL